MTARGAVVAALLVLVSGCARCARGDGESPPPAGPNASNEGPYPNPYPRPSLSGTAEQDGGEGDRAGAGAAGAAEERVLGVTYHVGPRRKLTHLGQVAPLLRPGDLVLVDGDATYTEDVRLTEPGAAGRRITVRGVRVNGKRPVLRGTVSAVELAGDHYVLEGFEVTGGTARCVFHHAADVTVRDTVVHGCPGHGILGADDDSGSLTLEYVEVYDAGSGEMKHPVYVTTDPRAHPGSVFRMLHCYVHDGHGGNAVKSRAERNEIYYNWIEGAAFEELGLYGPEDDESSPRAGPRADSDVVGNVLRKTGAGWYVARLGGDGTGQSWGRYRFVNNTVLLSPGAEGAFRITFGIDSLELHNNVFHRIGGGAVALVKDDGVWKSGRHLITGSNNVVPPGSTLMGSIPILSARWPATLMHEDCGFTDLAAHDLRLRASSPLVRAGNADPRSPSGHLFPLPLPAPLYLPPPRAAEAPGTARPRASRGGIAIGAFER